MLRTRRIPRGEKRRDEIAAVAERVFLELGFNDTTMQIVASRAGASKETLYRHFGSKEGLFSEVVRARANASTVSVETRDRPAQRSKGGFAAASV